MLICKRHRLLVKIDPRGRPQSRPVVITIFTQSVRIKRQSMPAGTVGWPSGSLMTSVLYKLVFQTYVQIKEMVGTFF